MTHSVSTDSTFLIDRLQVNLAPNRAALGQRAARAAAATIRQLGQTQPFIHLIFAAAPSQNEFLDALVQEPAVPWPQVRAFHMDEYLGLPADAPQSFGRFLRERLFDRVPIHTVFYMDGNAPDLETERLRYSALLEQYPADLVCMGIGENGHIAFNDPHVADFNDVDLVKPVLLDEVSRRQQVHDGCFATLDAVPRQALTLTIPALVRPPHIVCMVPGAHKADAVYNTLTATPSEKHPATVLRAHPNATLFIDHDSAEKFLAGQLSRP